MASMELENELDKENEDFNINAFWSQIVIDPIDECPLKNSSNDDSKIKIPLRALNLNSNVYDGFPPSAKRQKRKKSKQKKTIQVNKENSDPTALPSLELRKNSSEGLHSLNSFNGSQLKLRTHTNSAFEPLPHSKLNAKACFLNKSFPNENNWSPVKSSTSLLQKIENILAVNHQKQLNSSPKMDYVLCLSLVSSLLENSTKDETEETGVRHREHFSKIR